MLPAFRMRAVSVRVPLPDAFRRRSEGTGGTRPAIVGHRGAGVGCVRGRAPENTLAAIRLAAREGADAVEVDVRPCKTHEVVVTHDPDLARLFEDPRSVSALSLRELRELRADGEPIPTLDEVVALARDLGLGLNVEIKHDVPEGLLARTRFVAAVARALAEARVPLLVSSFDPALLAAHKALAPRVCHAQLVHESSYHDWALRVAALPHADGVHVERTLFVAARVETFVRARFANVWTVNDPAEALRCAALGAEAVITDAPGRLRALFREHTN